MDIRPLTDDFSVAGQITSADLAQLTSLGIKSIINNRPDAEAIDQPASNELAAQAAGLNITFVHIPVIPGSITDKNITDFKSACQSLPKPILAFCRTGTRCASLWALSEADSRGMDVLKITRNAGYDLTALKSRLASQSPTPAERPQKTLLAAMARKISSLIPTRFRK